MRTILKLIAAIIILWFIGAINYTLYTESYKITDRSQTQAIVVYAGGRSRLDAGISLLKAGYGPLLFVAGVDSADQLKNYLVENNVKPERVIYGLPSVKGRNDNATEIAEFISSHGLTSIRLVAFSYQMPRVLEEV
ncbi:MAG: YdcF family protein, partial [Janthinobacterium lividum]